VVSKEEALRYSPLTLAFLGDCVYELLVRQKIVAGLSDGACPVRKLHERAVVKVRASFQANAARLLEEVFTDEEADVIRRGRNAKSQVPKSASIADYRLATGLETLFGFLHLTGQSDRINELFEMIYEI
jgi:ribonuclease-3 family protein